MMITALGFGLSLGWVLPAQQAPADATKGPQWKDRAEYDLADAYTKAADGKSRLAALEKWKQANPDSEMWQMRDEFYLGVYGELKDNRKAFDAAKALRAKNPNHYYSITTILSLIYTITTPLPPAAADMATAEEVAKYTLDNADKVFAATNKPANLTDAQWAQNKPLITSLALRTNAWLWVQRKDDVRAETELTKVVQADPAQPQFSYFLGQAKFNQYQKAKNLAKVPEAVFHIARAAMYTGPNAMPAAQRTQFQTAVTNIYKQYHGDTTGLDAVLELAKNNAMPPAGFTIEDAQTIATREFGNAQAYDAAHPQQTFWRDAIRTPLSGADSDAVFAGNYKDALLPPGQPIAMFKAKIISMTPEISPKEMVVAVFDPNIADAKLTFDPPLPGMMPVGSEIEFKGTVKAYTKEPFMMTFAIDMEEKEMTGWTGTGPVGAKSKGKAAPAAGKGKAAPKGKGK